MSACDYLSDAETDVVLALNGITVLNELPEPAAPNVDPLRPAYARLPDYVREMLEKPLRNIRATHPEAVTMLRQRLSILENARQFGGSVKLESRIARTRAVLDHALAVQATPTTEERIGEIVIRDDAEAGQVVIKFPSDHTNKRRKRIRSAGFCTKGPRLAFHLRKISGGVNTALDDARRLVREILGETE